MKIKELRSEKGVTQKELAKIIGTTQATISDWEVEKVEPSIYWLSKLATVFDVSVDYLIGREDDFGVIHSENKETEQNSELERKILAVVREYPKGYEEEALRSVQNGLILAEHKASENQTKRTLKNIIKRVTK